MTALLGLSLKISLILVLALLAQFALRRRSAAARHGVLVLALACAGATPLIERVAPSWHVQLSPGRSEERIETRVLAIRHAPAPASSDVTPPARNLVLKLVNHETDQPSPELFGIDLGGVGTVLWRIWLLGAASSLITLFMGLAWLARLTRRATPVAHPRWIETAHAVATEMGLRVPVRLLYADHPTLLVTWGWVRPTIVVPRAAAEWPEDRIRVVLYHEYAHIQRHDWLVQMGAALLRAAHWFNPLMWLAVARLRQESERACDDVVLRRGVDAPDYAAHLLDIARGFTRQREVWVPAPAIARPSSLERRVSAMLDGRLNRRPFTPAACAVAALVLLAATVPIAGFGEPQAPSVLSGVLRDPDGQPVANATIYLTRVIDPGSQTAGVDQLEFETDATGRFEFSGLPPGEYRITSGVPGALPVMGLQVNAGEQIERDVRMRFGPFRELWTVVPPSLDVPPTRRPLPDGWRCAESGVPLCGPESLVEEFEGDEQARLASPFAVPRRLGMTSLESVQPFRGVNVDGVVEIEGRLGADGVFTNARVVSAAHPDLERAALETIARTKWEPARVRGAAVDVPMTVTFEVLREPRGMRRP